MLNIILRVIKRSFTYSTPFIIGKFMNFKKFCTTSILPCLWLTTSSFSAYGLGDIIGGIGYSRYDYNITSGPSTAKGTNLNAAFLTSLLGINPIASIVIGPMIKKETVGATALSTFNQKETYTTTQLGAEGGIKINLIPEMNFYGTFFASYGIANTLTEDIIGDGVIIPNQTINPSVSLAWQTGVKARGFYNINQIFGLGLGVELANGSYEYASSSLLNMNGNNILSIPSGKNTYTEMNINLQVALYL